MPNTRASENRQPSDIEQGQDERPELTIVGGSHPGCVHHWLLGEPTAGLIAANCRKCGAQRMYGAAPESTGRFDDYRALTASSTYHQGGQTRRSA